MNIKKLLLEQKEEKYKDFTKKLIPNIKEEQIIGVRVPTLRKIAKEIQKNNGRDEYLKNLPHTYLEENLIHAVLINDIKYIDEALSYTNEFLPHVDNWSVCDTLSPKIFKKNKDILIKKIYNWLEMEHTYTKRFAIKMLMEHYLEEDFDKKYLELIKDIKTDEYYVNMGRAWYFSYALIHQYDSSIYLFQEKTLDDFTHKMSIQKALDSLRIDEQTKKYLKSLR